MPGDFEARKAQLAVIANAHGDELLGFLTRETRSAEQAADLRQDVFLRLSLTETRGVGDLRAYLFRIARNLLADARRRKRIEAAIFDPEAANENVAGFTPSPEATAAGRDELAQLRAALAELPVHLRRALLWYRIDGLSLREIGTRLEVSESMASRYVRDALKHCQNRLGRAGH